MMEESPYKEGLTQRNQHQQQDGIERVIDIAIDPDSCDFEPLMKSMNGAAMTDLSIHDDLPNEYTYYHSSSYDEEENEDSRSFDSDNDDQHGHASSLRNTIRQTAIALINLLPLPSSFLGKVQPSPSPSLLKVAKSHGSQSDSSTVSSTTSSKVSSELSETYAAMLCIIFAAIILFSTFASGVISHLTGIGPERSIMVASQSFFYKHNKVSPQGQGLAPPIGTPLPEEFEVYADVDDLPLELLDTPIFWHVPRSAGTSMKNIFSSCFGKVTATEVGGLDEHRLDDRILTIKKQNGLFVNVDLYTLEGIEHARDMGLAQSNLAEVMFTPFAQESSTLFDSHHRGRLFTMIRHPVERMISLYYFLRLWDNKVKAQNLNEFVQTSSNNWMVRALAQPDSDVLDESHLNTAKEVLRRKFLVGLMEDKTESFRRFEEFFGFAVPSPNAQSCKNDIFYINWHISNPHPVPDQNDHLYLIVQKINAWDMALYDYAKQLFHEQEVLF